MRPAHQVVKHHVAVRWIAEAHHRLHAGHRFGAVATAAVVARLETLLHLLLAQRLDAFLAAIARVGLALLQQPLHDLGVAVESLRLVVGALVVVEPEPVHAVEDGLHRFRRGAFEIRVLDAQDEHALLVMRLQVTEQRRARAAYVQEARRAGCKPGSHVFWVPKEKPPPKRRHCNRSTQVGERGTGASLGERLTSHSCFP